MDNKNELFESIKNYLLDDANRNADGRIETETETELAVRLIHQDIKFVRRSAHWCRWECWNNLLVVAAS